MAAGRLRLDGVRRGAPDAALGLARFVNRSRRRGGGLSCWSLSGLRNGHHSSIRSRIGAAGRQGERKRGD
jgi:hypothetical protein